MDVVLDILGWVTMVLGGAFVLVGGIGVLRFPDMYTRLHAVSVTETLGAGLLLLGMLLHAGSWLVAVKLLLLAVFLFATSPTSAHALARTALAGGLKPRLWGDNPQATPADAGGAADDASQSDASYDSSHDASEHPGGDTPSKP